jgi:hypothetical protein
MQLVFVELPVFFASGKVQNEIINLNNVTRVFPNPDAISTTVIDFDRGNRIIVQMTYPAVRSNIDSLIIDLCFSLRSTLLK